MAVIPGNRKVFVAKMARRGYTLDEVAACIVSDDGTTITIDVDHPAFPRDVKPGFSPPPRKELKEPAKPLPGTELKAVLAGWPWRIKDDGKCLCGPMSAKMDEMGCDWCLGEGRQEILAVMEAEAKKRGLPWVEALAILAIRRAVSRALRKSRPE